MKHLFVYTLIAAVLVGCKTEQTNDDLALALAQSEMKRVPHPVNLDFLEKPKWDYCLGLELQSFYDLAEHTNNEQLHNYVYAFVDSMINNDGSIYGYSPEKYNIDHVNSGKLLFRVYDKYKEERFKKASDLLRSQMLTHPRTSEGGFWHKQSYPHQMWLDGLYMGAPFIAEYGKRNNEDVAADMVQQFLIVGKHTYDPATKLYRHAWDESRTMFWADSITGQSQHAWGRANGWFMMAMTDVLEFIPEATPGRDSLLTQLNGLAEALLTVRDTATGMWYQVLDNPGREGNYVESTCSAMFVYSFIKGARLGYLPAKFAQLGSEAYNQYVKNFVRVAPDGMVSITNCCAVAGLGGKRMRSGTYDYYISEPVRDNDAKAIGPFIMATLELDKLQK